MRLHQFETSATLSQPRERVFAFFSDAGNLERITPPELRFRIVTAPAEMAEGALIDYRLRLFGVPFGWRTRITRWDPPYEFVDEQLTGPYRVWMHRHTFLEVPEGTRIEDRVTYGLPFYPLGEAAAPLVHAQVRRIFRFRAGAISAALQGGDGRRGLR